MKEKVKTKTEKKKGITLKRLIIFVFILVMAIGLIIGVKWRILYNIQELNDSKRMETQWYYHSEADSTIMDVYRKGSIYKTKLKQKGKDVALTYWENKQTGEAYVFFENPTKKYQRAEGGIITDLPMMEYYTEDEKVRVQMAAMPNIIITTGKYGEKDCYIISGFGGKEYIEKATGLVLATQHNNEETRKINYEFRTITDEEIAMPDINQYEIIE